LVGRVAEKHKKKKAALMLGVGLDSDGHKRVTTGPNFALLGGSHDTHEAMTEKAIKINEKLAAKGKRLEDVSREEFDDIAHSVGLQRRLDKEKQNDQPNEKQNEKEKEKDEEE
jgi:hypothetical protein